MKETKKCKKCGETKPLSVFLKMKTMSDGYRNECRECRKKYHSKNREQLRKDPEWVKRENERSRQRYLNNPDLKKKAILKYKEKYPEKHEAKVKTKRLKPKIKGNNLHHWSYNEEHYTDTIELTKKDHYTAHRFMIYDQERRMYRTLKGELLDTKEEHLLYISININKTT
jgi:hypothetical protein